MGGEWSSEGTQGVLIVARRARMARMGSRGSRLRVRAQLAAEWETGRESTRQTSVEAGIESISTGPSVRYWALDLSCSQLRGFECLGRRLERVARGRAPVVVARFVTRHIPRDSACSPFAA